MSTQINVTVDRGGLLQRNQQQTTANRQGALEAADQQQVVKSASEQLKAKQAPEDSVGRKARSNPKPAANRIGTQKIYFGPLYAPVYATEATPGQNYQTTYHLLDTKNLRGAGQAPASLQASRAYLSAPDYQSPYTPAGSRILEGGGPSGANALEIWSESNSGNPGNFTSFYIHPPELDKKYTIETSRATVELFLQLTASGGSPYLQISCDLGDYFYLYWPENINPGDNNTPSFGMGSFSGTLDIDLTSLYSWSHLALTFDNGTVKIFLNGNLVNTYNTGIAGKRQFSQLDFDFGLFSSGNGGSISTFVSSMRIVNRVLYRSTFTPPTTIR